MRVFAHTSMAGKAAKGGFQGLYTYDVLIHDGRSFRRMCASARRLGLACAPSVGPGFDAFRATGERPASPAADGRWYDHMWRRLRAAPDVVTITSYNEWHEGTQIEPARALRRAVRDVRRRLGAGGQRAPSARTLDRTAYWVRARSAAGRVGAPATRRYPGATRKRAATEARGDERIVVAELLEQGDRHLAQPVALLAVGARNRVDDELERPLDVAGVERLDDVGQLADSRAARRGARRRAAARGASSRKRDDGRPRLRADELA